MGFPHGLMLLNHCSNILFKSTPRMENSLWGYLGTPRPDKYLLSGGKVSSTKLDKGAFWDNVCTGIFHSVLACT